MVSARDHDLSAPCFWEFDREERKLCRAAARSRALFQKKVEHRRAQTRFSLPPQLGDPHGAARSARRTVLVRGVVEDGTDIPNISIPDRSKLTRTKKLRKPYVTSLLRASTCLCVDHCHEEKLAEEAWDSARVEKELQAFHCGVAMVAMERHSIGATQHCELKQNQDGQEVSDQGLCQHMHCGSSLLIEDAIVNTSGLLELYPSECGFEEKKMRRTQERSRNHFRKKQRFQQRIGVAHVAPHQTEVPHGAARSALRTCLAQGALEDESDIPAISMPDRSKPRKRQKKPFVSPLLKPSPSPMVELEDFQLGDAPHGAEGVWGIGSSAQTTVNSSRTEMSFGEVLSTHDHADMDEFEASDVEGKRMSLQQEADGNGLRHIEVEESEVIELCEMVKDTAQSSQHRNQLLQHAPGKSANETCNSDDGKEDAIRKETILRQLVAALQAQVAEAQSTAAAARVQMEAAEERARMSQEAMRCSSMAKKDVKASIAEAQQMEKQRAIEFRRKRNQEAQLRATREKAEQELITAQQVKVEAQEEASAVVACIHAQADAAAHTVAAARAEAELQRQRVQAELETMKSTCMEMATKAGEEIRLEAQAAADATRQHVHQDAAEVMRQAEADVERMKAEVEAAAQARVQQELCETRSRALADAQALRSRAFEQLRFRVKEEASLQEAKMQSHAERRSKEELAQALQTVKAMERQRAKQFRQQAERERRERQLLDRELVGARAKAEAEIASLQQAALLEVKSAKQKASAQAEQLKRQARRAAATLQAEAVAQAQALQQAAEAEAKEVAARAADKMAEDEEQQRLSGRTRIVATPEGEEAHVKKVSSTARDEDEDKDEDEREEEEEEEEEQHWDMLLPGLDAAKVEGEATDWTLVA